MMEVCPVCNGLTEVLAVCPNCQEEMTDEGVITDYLGPYAPYELVAATAHQEHYCLHSAICYHCGLRHCVAVPLLPSPE